ncbi:hypothetical protein KAR34_01970, partial [bacterium]|nr:hypothetical protein [bacterium]
VVVIAGQEVNPVVVIAGQEANLVVVIADQEVNPVAMTVGHRVDSSTSASRDAINRVSPGLINGTRVSHALCPAPSVLTFIIV